MSDFALLPTPKTIRITNSERMAVPSTMTVAGPWAKVVALLLEPGTGIRTVEGDSPLLVTTTTPGAAGSYRLAIGEIIELAAPDLEGAVAALTTLRQLLPDWVHGPAPLPGAELTLPCVEIEDQPAFPWRGLHLDVARHFMPLPFLYRYVDLLVAHKMNRFHLHLTDDQGWRFEVRSHPRLTEAGAWRRETRFVSWDEGDGTPHGGCYTQDQLRALVGYAAQRGVTIVPEIDLPGHVRSLLHAYPHCGEGEAKEVATTFGIFDEVLHLTDETMGLVFDVLTELLDVFDSPWIHIGGDECPTAQWETSPAASDLARRRGLQHTTELQDWFTAQLRDWLTQRGRILVGWDEIVDNHPVEGAVVMAWRGPDRARAAIDRGQEVVIATWQHCYLDHYSSAAEDEPFAMNDDVPIESVAALDPTMGLSAEQQRLVLGVQAQMWTEYAPTPRHVEYMVFPRTAVLAELGWRGRAGWPEMRQRLERHLRRLDAAGVNYRPLDGPRPWQKGGTGRHRRVAR